MTWNWHQNSLNENFLRRYEAETDKIREVVQSYNLHQHIYITKTANIEAKLTYSVVQQPYPPEGWGQQTWPSWHWYRPPGQGTIFSCARDFSTNSCDSVSNCAGDFLTHSVHKSRCLQVPEAGSHDLPWGQQCLPSAQQTAWKERAWYSTTHYARRYMANGMIHVQRSLRVR